MTEVIMPQMGESIAEGTITKWFKVLGDVVERDEPLLEISTDKVDTEIPAPDSGVLSEIRVPEGETVPINTVLAVIGGEVSDVAPAAATPEVEAPVAPEPTPPATTPAAAAPSSSPSAGLRSSPLVRKMAAEQGVDLSLVNGTGRGGRISKKDLLDHLETRNAAPAPRPQPSAPAPTPSASVAAEAPSPALSSGDRVTVEPMTKMRKSIAEHMIVSRRTSAHVTTVFEADVTRIVQLRAENKALFARDGVRLTYTPFFVRAVVGALGTFPLLNASIDGDSIVYHKDVNIGIAVALDGGLIVPVIHRANEKSFLGLARAVNDVGERARTKKLTMDDVQGGTFTLTNPGPYGGLFGTPIINQPEVAILGLGGIHKRPVVVNDGIAVRSMVYLALSFDHRLIDGALGDQFMADVKKRLENWDEKIL